MIEFHFDWEMLLMKNKKKRSGFSLLEIIAAVVILAVVAAATVSAIGPLREKSRSKLDEHNISQLNGIVEAYYMERGGYPDKYMTYLKRYGYHEDSYHRTPYGGYYTFDSTTKKVVNTYKPTTP